MPTWEFAVELTIPDNTAFTVLVALRDLGYRDLTRVQRSDVLRLHVRDDAMSRESCAAALTRAEVVFNPNKHRLSYANGAVSRESEAVVSDKDDDTDALKGLLGSRFGIHGLQGLERAVSWRLFEGDAAASEDRLQWACRSLLANPHSQDCAIRRRPHYVALPPAGVEAQNKWVRGQDEPSHPSWLE
jgi:phosphoribosylformylglycinamidine (FGAM) synthase PurS component